MSNYSYTNHYPPHTKPCPSCGKIPIRQYNHKEEFENRKIEESFANKFAYYQRIYNYMEHERTDHGEEPFVVNIEEAAEENNTFRTAIWTGKHLQVTLMSINVREDIGLEVHPELDQFLRIEEGEGFVQMGDSKDDLSFERNIFEDAAIMVPAGTWHNITNTGNTKLKLYSIYAPPEHSFDTIHYTKADALAAEKNHY